MERGGIQRRALSQNSDAESLTSKQLTGLYTNIKKLSVNRMACPINNGTPYTV